LIEGEVETTSDIGVGAFTRAANIVAGKDIGMKRGQKDVVDMPTVRHDVVKIQRNITLRVDYDGGSRRLIGDEIGCMGEIAEIILFQQHGIFLRCMFVATSPPRHPRRRSASMGSTRVMRLCMMCSLLCGGANLPGLPQV
jgi:hypothetical protein